MNNSYIGFFSDAELVARSGGADNSEMLVEGYALKFDKETVIGGRKNGFRERISRSAFNGADLSDVVFNVNHNESALLSRTSNGSLQLETDSTGLFIRAKIIDTTDGRDVYKKIQAGLIRSMSFQAFVEESDWSFERNTGGADLRVITRFGRFIDVSAVTIPAYADTSIVARCIDAAQSERESRYKAYRKSVYDRQIAELEKVIGK